MYIYISIESMNQYSFFNVYNYNCFDYIHRLFNKKKTKGCYIFSKLAFISFNNPVLI